MTSESDVRPGDIFTTPTYGNWYDRFIGAGIRYFTATKNEYGKWEDAKVNHTGIYVGNGKIIEAAPGGVRYNDWDAYEGDKAFWSSAGIAPRLADGSLGASILLTDEQRSKIVEAATSLLKTPYGFLDIVAIAFAQQRLDSRIDVRKALAEQPWWVQKIESRKTIICSELVDTSYRMAGIQLFEDGRLPGLVSPADIYGLYV